MEYHFKFDSEHFQIFKKVDPRLRDPASWLLLAVGSGVHAT